MPFEKFSFNTLKNFEEFVTSDINSENGLQVLLSNVKNIEKVFVLLKKLTNIVDLNLMSCNIDVLDSNAFESLVNLQNLSLEKNSLRSLPEGLFKSNKQLNVVNLRYNLLTELPLLLFLNLTNLKSLDLSQNAFKKLPFFFIRNKTLETLFLNNNEITDIDRYSFANLKSLISLNLENNFIYKLANNIFYNLNNLKNLNLNNNKIVEIEGKTMKDLKNLESLYLEQNALKSLSEYVFKNNKKLIICKILSNPLRYIDVNLFKNTPLEHIELEIESTIDWKTFKYNYHLFSVYLIIKNSLPLKFDYDFVKYFENKLNLTFFKVNVLIVRFSQKFCFNTLQFLKEMYIESIVSTDEEKLSLITWKCFHGMNCLKKLTLINLNLFFMKTENIHEITLPSLEYILFSSKSINVSEFPFLSNLKYLKLDCNSITVLFENTFKHIPNLALLFIKSVCLSNLSSIIFEKNTALIELEISETMIEIIPNNLFASLNCLRILNLSKNFIQKIKKSTFVGLCSLILLDLSYNPIQFFDTDAILELKILEVLVFDGVYLDVNFENINTNLKVIK